MAKLSEETIRARLLVLCHARAWMLDQVTGEASSDTLLNEDLEMSPAVSLEGYRFCKEIALKIEKLQIQLKALSQ